MRYIIIPLAIILYIWSGYIVITELNTNTVSFSSVVFVSCNFTVIVITIGYFLPSLIKFITKHW